VEFVGMAGLGTPDSMEGFVKTYDLAFPQAVSVDGRLWATFGVGGQPAWVFIDDSGKSDLYPFELPRDELEQILENLIAR
jgi:hypothetical protein